jgi:catechol 2,3-dioxygenase-like lactoylglutathione lyase family enzyme
MAYYISGIQQIGIGVADVKAAFNLYRKAFGNDIPVFDEAAEAAQMLPYTAGKPHMRHAILAINMKGGGGYEIWQYTSRKPEAPKFDVKWGDLGILATKIKSDNISAAYAHLEKIEGITLLSSISKDFTAKQHFYCKDLYGNVFEIVEEYNNYFSKGLTPMGGPVGAVIGVSSIEKSLPFYQKVLGFDKVIYQDENTFAALKNVSGGAHTFKRILLTHSQPHVGSFSRLLGANYIELVQVIDRAPNKIFENRLWGDLGYIHLCFDIINMSDLKTKCAELGQPFTVESDPKFEMGDAAGQFTYCEDPDGTLIEFVETYKLPVLKKINWYLDLRKRDRTKPLPDWMLKSMRFNRIKD